MASASVRQSISPSSVCSSIPESSTPTSPVSRRLPPSYSEFTPWAPAPCDIRGRYKDIAKHIIWRDQPITKEGAAMYNTGFLSTNPNLAKAVLLKTSFGNHQPPVKVKLNKSESNSRFSNLNPLRWSQRSENLPSTSAGRRNVEKNDSDALSKTFSSTTITRSPSDDDLVIVNGDGEPQVEILHF